ncbi:hypothetical protein CDV55_106527 [Aspergillus turcosus]|uniref:Branched-chain amino acid aminotransferase n=1 Tax=Aspergillus turcosus TaxID=1245748 RepID=A0A397HRI6_9EURO|nr:hypothetical protein CDV55_106527 [Aspergillus turcosus]RLL99831.1 hypothetical protein CFD26_106679 [Aspergillus turcosus]
MTSMDKVFAGYAARQALLKTSQNPYSQGIAWVEGELVPLAEARIPLLDQGFLHSDLTYDVPSVWDGRFFRLDDHLDRLEASCAKLQLKRPLPREQLKQTLVEMVVKSGLRDAFVEVIVTRGLKWIRDTPLENMTNNLYMFAQPYIWTSGPEEQRGGGGRAVLARTVRRVPPGAIDPTIKNLQWGGSHAGVMEVARAKGMEVRLEMVPVELAYTCDEIFMCMTAGGIMPITWLDGKPVNGGEVGPVTKAIWDGYWDMHYDDKYT